METLTQPARRKQEAPLVRKIQFLLTEDAYLRLHLAARKRGVSPGRVISDLAMQHLPAVSGEAA